ncbi:hypothetical protein [Rheinheimera hassiensis]|uniref:hypothetical protein n=1 Tax=Rheinheimera hassiensis TaxID=1193627 RepID=UPI001F0659EF|nr:hypothetical protein [Rheinheimera hassiensis]
MQGMVINDLNQRMPSHGENSLFIFFNGSDLTIEVKFDGKERKEEIISIKFRTVSFYAVGSLPGAGGVAGSYDVDFRTGCVIKAENSDLSAKWSAHWAKSGLKRCCAHFVMFWGAENKVVHVVAESSELS